jgi:folate-dependent phosphoribosylglycinamide formyltransferase PurN/GNAT superfamily N-acetyltransferase
VPVNLLATLGDRYGADALANARRDAEARGYRLVRYDAADDRLAAWIDWTFAPSWWSSEARATGGWYAQTESGEIAGFASFGVSSRAFPQRYPWVRDYREREDVGIFGPFGVAPAHRKTGVGAALLDAALASLGERRPLALIPAVAGDRLIAMYASRTGARIADTFAYELPRARAVIMASGSGTNAQAVIDAVAAGRIALDLHVVTNRAGALVRERARAAGIADEAIVWQRATEERAAFDARVIDAVAARSPELVLLLGWMHLLPAAFVERFPETLNLHPAFLPFDPAHDDVVMPDGARIPAFRGARCPEATIAAGVGWSGVSVHRVTAATDRGEVLVRTPLRVAPGTSLEALEAGLRPLEHAAVVTAIRRWGFER